MTVDVSPRYGLTSAHIVKYYKGDNYSAVNSPLHTITVKERNALIESHLCLLRNNQDCKSLDEPMPTLCTSGGHISEIRTVIAKYDNTVKFEHWAEVRDLLNTYCGYSLSDDDILLLEIDGEQYYISDIGMRMLTPRELYRAQGFPEDYIIEFDVNGKQYPRSAQVARCGNAVPPSFAEAKQRYTCYEGDNGHNRVYVTHIVRRHHSLRAAETLRVIINGTAMNYAVKSQIEYILNAGRDCSAELLFREIKRLFRSTKIADFIRRLNRMVRGITAHFFNPAERSPKNIKRIIDIKPVLNI